MATKHTILIGPKQEVEVALDELVATKGSNWHDIIPIGITLVPSKGQGTRGQALIPYFAMMFVSNTSEMTVPHGTDVHTHPELVEEKKEEKSVQPKD